MNKSAILLCSLALFAAASCSDEKVKMPWEDDLNKKHQEEENKPGIPEAKIGETLPDWSEGCLDIHLINSGRGECIFHILPDGTTLLVDAGEMTAESTSVAQKPNESTRPYIVDATYIKHFLPEGKTSIDWCAPSHFHGDHIGTPLFATETSPNGYALTGMIALYNEVPYARILDMGYPDYREDKTIPELDGALVDDWIKFVRWTVANKGVKADRFRTGEEQIVLVNNKEKYPDFKIFNICANGYVWKIDSATGEGSIINANAAKGNPASCGFHLTYGKFDYITCGDLTGGPQNRVAEYIKAAIAPGGFDVFKVHHHLSNNSWGSTMQTTQMSPRVIVNQNFYKKQPDPTLLNSIATGVFEKNTYTWTKDFFTTNMHPEAISENPGIVNNLKDYNGHIVVRVVPGGNEYYVYLLDDTDFNFKVKSIHGPYSSK